MIFKKVFFCSQTLMKNMLFLKSVRTEVAEIGQVFLGTDFFPYFIVIRICFYVQERKNGKWYQSDIDKAIIRVAYRNNKPRLKECQRRYV
jgi:hypothetical protein